MDGARLTPAEARRRIRAGELPGPTSGLAAGHLQANLVVVPAAAADAFAAYCAANPAPCPLLERLAPGDPVPHGTAPDADLRFDLPRYRWHGPGGTMTEHGNLANLWPADAVAFLLGCSFTFEDALSRAGLVPRHIEEGRNVPMFRTGRRTAAAGAFAGPLVVSMRPIPESRVADAHAITAAFPLAHGAPVHAGDPAALGIADLDHPDWGNPATVHRGEVAVFWACGVTSQVAVGSALAAGAIPWAITHAPGHMFITDLDAEAARGRS